MWSGATKLDNPMAEGEYGACAQGSFVVAVAFVDAGPRRAANGFAAKQEGHGMTIDGLTVRLVEDDDLPAIQAHFRRHLAESGNGEPVFVPYLQGSDEAPTGFDVEKIGRPIGTPGWQRWFAAFDTDRRVGGHLDLKGDTMATGVHRCTLGIGIERPYRGRGLGRALMEAGIDLCRQADGVDWIDLYVFAHNEPARALYRKLGFVEIGTVTDRFRIGDTVIDDVIMSLPVAAGR